MDGEALYRSIAFGAWKMDQHIFDEQPVAALAVDMMIADGAVKREPYIKGQILGRMRDTGKTLLEVLNEGGYWVDSLDVGE